jgi:periplasmic protein TonB
VRAPRSLLVAEASIPRVIGIVLTSIGTHMLILGVLGFMPTPDQFFEHNPTEMEVLEPEPPPPPPPPPVEPPKPKEPEPQRAAPKPAAAPKPLPTPEPPKPQAAPPPEAPIDFGGVTQTAEGSSWSTVVGSGAALTAPVGRIGTVTGKDKAGEPAAPQAPRVVAQGSLSRAAVPPPDMNDLLMQNYPARARAQGVAGSAKLSIRIHADGHISNIQLLRETGDYGFGDACMKILRLRRWQPPLDKEGRAVATDARYECAFEVAY